MEFRCSGEVCIIKLLRISLSSSPSVMLLTALDNMLLNVLFDLFSLLSVFKLATVLEFESGFSRTLAVFPEPEDGSPLTSWTDLSEVSFKRPKEAFWSMMVLGRDHTSPLRRVRVPWGELMGVDLQEEEGGLLAPLLSLEEQESLLAIRISDLAEVLSWSFRRSNN